jgi:hypothetical protein
VPPRKRVASPPPLTDSDVATLRAQVSNGEKPRVVVRTASAAVPAGTRGSIVRIGNPSDGEYVVVRLGNDEVPFAPSELALTGRAARTAAAAGTAPVTPAARPAPKKSPKRRATVKAAPEPTPATAATPAPASRAAGSRKKSSPRPSSRRSLPPLVVNLRFSDGEWTVEAARGARRLTKASAVRPGAVKAFAELVDEPVVREALIETIESCRSVVEERAAALRAELVAAEAALKEYDARKR